MSLRTAVTPQEVLESLIDDHTLARVLEMLSTICHEKSEHIVTNWQDKNTAHAWDRAAVEIYNLSAHSKVQAVS